MSTYNWDNISDHDFEGVCRDVLSAHLDAPVERFARGADQGVDLRAHISGELIIGQAKHYRASSFSTLLGSVRREVPKLRKLQRQPARYILLTSRALTPGNKQDILREARPYITATTDIWGLDDLESFIALNPTIEEAHLKLWLCSSRTLERIMQNPAAKRSEFRITELVDRSRLFVPHGQLDYALETLDKRKSVIISGPAGVGKTTMSEMISLRFLEAQAEVVFASSVAEIEANYSSQSKQLFIFDDFLGKTTLRESPSEPEQERLVALIRAFRRAHNKYLVLTTREYLYQETLRSRESLARETTDIIDCIVSVEGYSTTARAKILYNHLYWSQEIPTASIKSFVDGEGYWPVIEHANFNPRWIADVLNRMQITKEEVED
jgi:Restriction endonuclease